MLAAIAVLSLVIWIMLLVARGGFWQAHERDDQDPPGTDTPDAWPAVVAVIPARNEAASIAQTVSSLLRQDYPGSVRVVVVDDHSEDGTAALARDTAHAMGAAGRLTVLRGEPLLAGWTGKLWAVRQGIDAAHATDPPPAWLLLTDADIEHAPDNLRQLVTRAIVDRRVMVSLMVKLRCDAWFERALIPAFVLFFQMLYPFSWVNRRDHPMAAAAGGCMLVQAQALRAAGGIEAIRDEIIDDCALGARMKSQGAIWLGLTNRARSVRPYDNLGEIHRMVARTAYAQLHYSPWWLCGTIVSLLVTFVAPPLLVLFGSGFARVASALAWAAMTFAYLPMLRFYGRSRGWGPCLPVIAVLYTAFTLDSALQHWRGRGGMWKGRAQARH
ncbi:MULTISPECIES: glycosyltransferase [Mycetohabitans]|uniref:glycosyltransferase n=1 Tax=Mycetohabitans TaxID=2571159 RepID=UPI002106B364|nr:glycosyltransferase [Mycetohabitans sp. B3]MCF2135379.1 glycosyltransferase [Mycetohabitans sp. B3]